jgi:hypothetical protein
MVVAEYTAKSKNAEAIPLLFEIVGIYPKL